MSRRDVHNFPAPHDECHAPAECDCECRGCKRTWEGIGRPGPEAPRRSRLDKLTHAERAILDAVRVVEASGCDMRLTEAVILLQKARDKVADFVDGVEHPLVSYPSGGVDAENLRLARARIKALEDGIVAENRRTSLIEQELRDVKAECEDLNRLVIQIAALSTQAAAQILK